MQPFKQAIRRFHHRLSDIDALPQLTLLGIIVGVLASLCIVAFRLLIEVPLAFFLPQHNENFEALSASLHFFIPVIGALHWPGSSQRSRSSCHPRCEFPYGCLVETQAARECSAPLAVTGLQQH